MHTLRTMSNRSCCKNKPNETPMLWNNYCWTWSSKQLTIKEGADKLTVIDISRKRMHEAECSSLYLHKLSFSGNDIQPISVCDITAVRALIKTNALCEIVRIHRALKHFSIPRQQIIVRPYVVRSFFVLQIHELFIKLRLFV